MAAPYQDLVLDPAQPVVGRETTITFQPQPAGVDRAGVELRIVWADGGETVVLGRTDAEGRLVWTPAAAGKGKLQTTVRDIEYVADVEVATSHGFLGFVVPWSLASLILLYITMRARRRERRARGRGADEAQIGSSTS